MLRADVVVPEIEGGSDGRLQDRLRRVVVGHHARCFVVGDVPRCREQWRDGCTPGVGVDTGVPQHMEHEGLRFDREGLRDVGRGHVLGTARGRCRVRGHQYVRGPGRETRERVVRAGCIVLACGRHAVDEPLLSGLFAHAHAGADRGPRCSRAAGLVDEVTDQAVGDVAQVLRGDHRVGELVQRVVVDLADGMDQVVEADGD